MHMCVCVCVRACMRVCVHVCVCAPQIYIIEKERSVAHWKSKWKQHRGCSGIGRNCGGWEGERRGSWTTIMVDLLHLLSDNYCLDILIIDIIVFAQQYCAGMYEESLMCLLIRNPT